MIEQGFDLRSALGIAWRRKPIIVVSALLAGAAALVHAAFLPTVYRAASRVVVIRSSPLANAGGNSRNQLAEDPATLAEIVSSSAVAARVVKTLKVTDLPEKLATQVRARPEGQLLEIEAHAKTPNLSALLANTFADEFIAYRREQAARLLQPQVDVLAREGGELQKQTEELSPKISELSAQVAVLCDPGRASPNFPCPPGQAAERGRREAELQRLTTERDEAIVRLTGIRTRIADAQNTINLATIAAGEVIQRAGLPSEPMSPRPKRDGTIAGLMGMVLGFAIAFLREQFDRRIHNRADAVRTIGAPVLASVPKWRQPTRNDPYLISVAEPDSQAGEAYRALRANLFARGVGGRVRCILVTSTGPGEGKTATVANLAVACANVGMRTLAVSADLRRPRLAGFLGLEDNAAMMGIADVLRGKTPLSAAVLKTAIPRLWFLGSGSAVSHGGDLLGLPKLAEIIGEAETLADVVIMDASALSDGADAVTLARVADASLLVVEAHACDATSLALAGSSITQAGSPTIGMVLNRASGGRDLTPSLPIVSAMPSGPSGPMDDGYQTGNGYFGGRPVETGARRPFEVE
ncbi:MAG: polysaccharide biosynthesis tyrosine autokinase [Actinomycetota bacterium]